MSLEALRPADNQWHQRSWFKIKWNISSHNLTFRIRTYLMNSKSLCLSSQKLRFCPRDWCCGNPRTSATHSILAWGLRPQRQNMTVLCLCSLIQFFQIYKWLKKFKSNKFMITGLINTAKWNPKPQRIILSYFLNYLVMSNKTIISWIMQQRNIEMWL